MYNKRFIMKNDETNNSLKIEEAVVIGETKSTSIVEFGELVGMILDYYDATGSNLEEGDEWKRGTEHASKMLEVPEDVDGELKKAFISQIKKFQ